MLTYSPGGWHAVATPTSVALLAPDVPVSVLHTVWESMAEGEGLAAVLGGLVGTFGMSLGAFPSFVIVSYDPALTEARVIVRGPLQVRVATEDEPAVQVSGLGVTSWTERVVTHPTLVELGVLDDSAPVLPLRDGVVAAGAVRWQLVASAVGAGAVAEAAEPLPVADVIPPPLTTAVPPPPPPPAAPEVPQPEAPLPEPVAESVETVIPDVAETRTDAHDDEGFDATTGYDDLIFGETRISTVEDAAVRAPSAEEADALPPASVPPGLIDGIPPASAGVPASAPTLGDHDGETISAEQLAALMAGASVESSFSASVSSRQVPTLIVSTGERYTLDRSAVVGLRPRAVRATGTVPHLVVVASDNGHISRSHVEIRVEGADVLAVDLNATNGTRLLRLGADPVRLHPGESTLLVTGDRLDLGDEVVLSFEGI